MTLEIKKSAGETTIKVVGRLDSFTAPVLEKMINKAALGEMSIVLELSGVEQVSDVGVSVLLNAHRKMSEMGSLRLTGVCESVMETFRTAGCADVLVIN